MPLEDSTTSKHDDQYCIYCQDQTTGDLASYEEVKQGSINAAVKHMGKTLEEAEQMVGEMLPQLPRWKEEQGESLY